jgi:hypothetical protein
MSFGWFLLIGWIRIRCRKCSSRLILRSVGDRFWIVLAGGVVAIAAIVLYLDFPFRAVGQTGTIVIFISIILLTLVLSLYFAWTDSQFDVIKNP